MAADPPITVRSEERLLSDATAAAVGDTFAQLAAIRRQQRRMTEFPMGGSQQTVEDLVRELLNPMMRNWLEDKAAPIVERAVQSQLARALGQVDRK
jgi:cell pole-organizing protein PopZ